MKSIPTGPPIRCSMTLIALTLTALSGCSTLLGVSQVVDPAPPNLTQPCPEPQPVKPKLLMGDLAELDAELAGQYRECARNHQGLIDWHNGITKPKDTKPWWKLW